MNPMASMPVSPIIRAEMCLIVPGTIRSCKLRYANTLQRPFVFARAQWRIKRRAALGQGTNSPPWGSRGVSSVFIARPPE